MSQHTFPAKVVEIGKHEFHNPLVIGGFVDAGLVGVASVSYIIEHLELSQVAYVKSEHIPPVAVFIGERLRRAFRIYSDKEGKLLAVLCEVPVELPGLYEISSVLLDWVEQIGAKEIVLIDGIAVKGILSERETYCVADENRCKELKGKGFRLAQAAMISGLSGALLSECLGRKVAGVSLLTPASIAVPDPGAILSSIRAMNSLYNLRVDTTELEKGVSKLEEYLKTLVEQHKKLQEQKETEPERIYG